MPSVTIPKMDIEYINIGPATTSNFSSLLLTVDGVNYATYYTRDTGTYSRYLYPIYNSTTNYIQVACLTMTYKGDAPAETFTNIEVYLIG